MFRDHQPICARHASEPQGFLEAGAFVLCTIRVPLERAIIDFQDWKLHGSERAFWGWKRHALGQFQANAAERKRRLDALYPDRDAMLAEVCRWRGFGPAKGGFLLQIVYGLSGCLDSHNLAAHGLGEREFRIDGKGERGIARVVERYHKAVDKAGGCEALWDTWCEGIAALRPDTWSSGDQVSRYHAIAIAGDDGEPEEPPF
jgi:hypothetical protein